eukprot:TRINITY_DN16965_c0_g1_i1.p1 TRINITY_DN16965_c0_g1~~TRINITY_DN16965_c0_g1_i1.p1  ORF type:complete len:205 (-),score=33.99 TRINITY_DN16965_c0_g1_i1:61-675(-)
MSAVAVFFLFVALAAAQTKPVWPKAASTSVFVSGWGEGPQGGRHFIRWFYDETLQKERIDGPRDFFGEQYWTTVIVDHKAGKESFIVYQPDLVSCVVGPANHTTPHPDFSKAVFVGKSLIDYQLVNNWVERLPTGGDGLAIFDYESNGEIARIDFHDHRRGNRAVSFKFMEFDAGSQDPSLFVIPSAIAEICGTLPHQFVKIRN